MHEPVKVVARTLESLTITEDAASVESVPPGLIIEP